MSLAVANVLWGVGAVVVLVLAAVVYTRVRRGLLERRSVAASDDAREQQELRDSNLTDVHRIDQQRQANESAARGAVNHRPPV